MSSGSIPNEKRKSLGDVKKYVEEDLRIIDELMMPRWPKDKNLKNLRANMVKAIETIDYLIEFHKDIFG